MMIIDHMVVIYGAILILSRTDYRFCYQLIGRFDINKPVWTASYTVHTYYTGNLRREREPKNICTQLLLLNLSCKERISHLGLKNKWLPRSCHLDIYLPNCLENNESKMWKRKREKSPFWFIISINLCE